jgi:biopolymer transport protein ExbD
MYNFKDYWKKSTITFQKHVKVKKGALDIAPLVDVIFLLIIFFMLTSSFVSQPGIPVNLPKALTGEMLKQKKIVLTITKDNVYYLDNKKMNMKELKAELKKMAKSNEAVYIRGDEQVTLGRIAEVWDLCRELGISQTNIAITPKR